MKYKNIMEALESGNKVTYNAIHEKAYFIKKDDEIIDYMGRRYKKIICLIGEHNLTLQNLFSEWYDYEEENNKVIIKIDAEVEFESYKLYKEIFKKVEKYKGIELLTYNITKKQTNHQD